MLVSVSMEIKEKHVKPRAADYDTFAEFYDELTGNRQKVLEKVSCFIQENHPEAKTILELGAGTGANLVSLADHYDVSGLDLSEKMLEVAQRKLPDARFYQEDMVTFKLEQSFDVVLCLFDSINHLLDKKQWVTLFQNVYDHLNEGGAFIFDMNTPEKLQMKIEEGTSSQEIKAGRVETVVQNIGGGVVNWHIVVHEQRPDGKVIDHEENIKEIAFQADEIQSLLEQIFPNVQMHPTLPTEGKPVTRVYFICKK